MNSILGKYIHFKGNTYNVVGTAVHTETNEDMIIYENEEKETFVRPRKMFFEEVEVDGKPIPRFKKINNKK